MNLLHIETPGVRKRGKKIYLYSTKVFKLNRSRSVVGKQDGRWVEEHSDDPICPTGVLPSESDRIQTFHKEIKYLWDEVITSIYPFSQWNSFNEVGTFEIMGDVPFPYYHWLNDNDKNIFPFIPLRVFVNYIINLLLSKYSLQIRTVVGINKRFWSKI